MVLVFDAPARGPALQRRHAPPGMQDGTAIGQPAQSRAGQQFAEVDARQQQVGATPVAVASTEQRVLQHAQ